MVTWRTSAARRRGAAGYSLVMLIMAVTVLNIMIAVALPKWSEMIKRDKEEELISRGWQYAEAIRLFQKRFQRYPVKLDELIKVKPRCIRQLWKDPMTASGEWAPILLGGVGSPIHPPGTPETPKPQGQGLDPNQPQITNGPIVGVRSRSPQKSLLVFFGHERYDEWEFRVEMLTQGGGRRYIPGRGAGLTLSTRWLGRPMPSFVPPGSQMPNGLPGGPPGGPPRPVGGVLGGGNPGKP